jgi:hypothetical protein
MMKSSEILREAKYHLAGGPEREGWPDIGRTEYICYALVFAARTGKDVRTTRAIRERLSDRLGTFVSLRDWLADKLPSGTEIPHDKMQAHRLAWMEMLALEYESEGD